MQKLFDSSLLNSDHVVYPKSICVFKPHSSYSVIGNNGGNGGMDGGGGDGGGGDGGGLGGGLIGGALGGGGIYIAY